MNVLIVSSWLFIFLRCRSVIMKILVFLLLILYGLNNKKSNIITCVITACIMFVYLIPPPIEEISVTEGIVVETRLNTSIAKFDDQYVLIYHDKPLVRNTRINKTGTCRAISTQSNFHHFDAGEYYRNKKIYWSCNQDEIEIVHENQNLQSWIYHQIQKVKNETSKELLLSIFFQSDLEEASHLLTSAGLHVSYLNHCILSSLPYGEILASLFFLFLGYNLPFSISYYRCIISNLLSLLKKRLSSKERLGYEMLIMMLLYPGCVFELGFILPIGIKFISQFNLSKSQFTIKVFLIWIQCQSFFQYDLISIFFYRFYQILNTILFLLSWLICLIPKLEFILLPFHGFMYIPKMIVTGSFPLILSIIFFYLLFQLMKQDSIKTKILMFTTILCMHLQAYLNPCYQVTFLNVGQGDSILIELPFQQSTILIDVPANQADVVVDECKGKGIHKINTLILTHDDSDHAGGKDELIKKIQVDEIIEDKQDIKTSLLTMKCLNQQEYGNENDDSLVYTFDVQGVSYLMMADVSKVVEEDLVSSYDLKCDILKVGHHGSKTSTSSLFIQQVQPKLAIISCLRNNVYGHPHKETMQTLENYGVEIFNTSEDGAISITSFMGIHWIMTSNGQYSLIYE